MAEINYTKTTDETQKFFLSIPGGDYMAVIKESDYKKNNKKTGKLLSLKWEIINGNFKGHKIPDQFHLEHENLQTKQIGERRYNSLKQVLGVDTVQDSSQLHDIPCIIRVIAIKDEEYGDENDMKNEIKGYKSIPKSNYSIESIINSNKSNESEKIEKRKPWER